MKQSSLSLLTIISLAVVFLSNYVVQALPIAGRSSTSTKLVTIHHIVGNTYNYTKSTWESDVLLASSNNIDAIALNMGTDSWQVQQIENAYDAAEQSGTGFKMYLSFDMTVMPCTSAADAQNLVNLVRQFSGHPAQLQYPLGSSKALVTTFSGESCTFGQSSPQQAWENLFKNELQNEITFVPSLFVAPDTFPSWSKVHDGELNWNSAWATQITPPFLTSLLNAVGQTVKDLLTSSQNSPAIQALNQQFSSISNDNEYINNLNGKVYNAAVSPWFFTHFAANEEGGKNFLYCTEDSYPIRWNSIVQNRNVVDIMTVLSMNDYGESHYIGQFNGMQPNSQPWTNGFDHTPFMKMTAYYAAAYKSGQFPKIEDDEIYVWGRASPAAANSPDPVPKPTNYQTVSDNMYVLVLASEPSQVLLSTAENPSENVQTFNVPAGATTLAIPLTANGGMSGTIVRSGKTIASVHPEGFKFDPNPTINNFNVFAAMGSA